MIFVTGDTHGEPKRLNTENFPEQKELCREDYVIICGDWKADFVMPPLSVPGEPRERSVASCPFRGREFHCQPIRP